jgi:uncharacterized membrane protein
MSTIIESGHVESIRNWAKMHYILHLVGIVFTLGTLTLLAVILNYVKRGDADGTYVRSHMDYMISSWWRMVIWTIVLSVAMSVFGVITLGIGFFLWFLVSIPAIIFAIRMVLGLMKLSDGKSA